MRAWRAPRAPPHGRADVRARLLAARDVIKAGDGIAVGSFAVAYAQKNIRSENFVERKECGRADYDKIVVRAAEQKLSCGRDALTRAAALGLRYEKAPATAAFSFKTIPSKIT